MDMLNEKKFISLFTKLYKDYYPVIEMNMVDVSPGEYNVIVTEDMVTAWVETIDLDEIHMDSKNELFIINMIKKLDATSKYFPDLKLFNVKIEKSDYESN